jgi:hypothetical protein
MSLRFHTAPYAYRGEDRVDVTRTGCDRLLKASKPAPGVIFAPSEKILWPAKAHIALVDALNRRAALLPHTESGAFVAIVAEKLALSTDEAYANLYKAEMRSSYRQHAAEWRAFLARDEATVVCYCPRRQPGHGQRHTCHRHYLATFLAACGAVDMSEREAAEAPAQAKRGAADEDIGCLFAVSGCRPPPPDAPEEHARLFMRIVGDVQERIAGLPAGTRLVHGGAAGVDTVAEKAARKAGLPASVIYRPWYDAWGKRAPMMRNAYVATAARGAFWPAPWGRGTQHAIDVARKAGVDATVRNLDG